MKHREAAPFLSLSWTGFAGLLLAITGQFSLLSAAEIEATRLGAVAPQQVAAPGSPSQGSWGRPKPGPCPLPILPALARMDDTAFFAIRDVPHGRVEVIKYRNHAGTEKRMHVYLPPGYDQDAPRRYPVLYLNHGGGDDDAGWTSTDPENGGHAQAILDNLIARRKARPMIIVMPNTWGLAAVNPPPPGEDDACTREYLNDIIPLVDSRYRTQASREGRALAGLSMGGFVVMHTGLSHLETFSELYVFSSGHSSNVLPKFEERFRILLQDAETNDKFRVPFYMAQGETDSALRHGQNVMAVLNKYGLRNFWVLSSGGHEWANWRRYLHQTAQIMFPDSD
jgi:enterochelin esterase family protein